MNNMEKKVINGAISLLISGLIVKMLSLVYKIPLSYILSDEGMSYFNSAYTVYTFFYIICTAGVPKAISILIAKTESEGRDDYTEYIYKTVLRVFLTLGITVTIIFAVFSRPISYIIGNSGASFTMIAIAPSVFFVCASGVLRGYFNGKLNFLPIAVSEIISGFAKLILGVVFVILGAKFGLDLYRLSAFTVLGITLGTFLGYLYLAVYKKTKTSKVNLQQKRNILFNKRQIIRDVFRIAIPITLTSAIGSISNIIDLSVIMHRLKNEGYTELQSGILYGNYTTLAIPMINLLGMVIAPITSVLLPIISKSDYENKKYDLTSHISLSIKTVFFIVMPITLLYTFNAYEILALIFEDSSASMAAPMLALLAPGVLFMSLATLLNTSLEGMGKTNIPLLSLTFATIIKIVITYILVGSRKYGIMGASIGTSISYLFAFLISFYYLCIIQKISIKIVVPFLQTGIASLAAVLISSLILKGNWEFQSLKFITQMAIFALIYLVLLLVFGFVRFQNITNISKIYKKGKE